MGREWLELGFQRWKRTIFSTGKGNLWIVETPPRESVCVSERDNVKMAEMRRGVGEFIRT